MYIQINVFFNNVEQYLINYENIISRKTNMTERYLYLRE